MRCHTATHCEDTLCNSHTTEVFRRCFDTHQNNFALFLRPCFCVLCREHYLTGSSTWRCRKTLGYDLSALECGLVEYRVEKFVEFLRLHTAQHGLFVDNVGTKQIHSDFHHSCTCAFAVTGLKHPQLAVLNGKFHILHILIVCFKTVSNCEEFLSANRH